MVAVVALAKVKRAVLNLVLGRVALQYDYTAGDATIKVGDETTDETVAGTGCFIGTSTSLTIVQPDTTDTPTGIEDTENFTVTEPDVGTLHLTPTAPLANNYTTARGAYVRLATVPEPMNSLKVVGSGMWLAEAPPTRDKFPCVQVYAETLTVEPAATVQFDGAYSGYVDYYSLFTPTDELGYTHEALVDALVNWLLEDNQCGGTCWDFGPVAVNHLIDAANEQMGRWNAPALGLDVWRISWAGKRRSTWSKL